nr:pseudouridine synthase [uncultured Sphaerochaeta sp.]
MNDTMQLELVYEDHDILVVNKQANLPTVPLKTDKKDKLTLLGLVSLSFPEVLDVGGVNTWEGGVLHRLDTATSGLVVIARTKEAYTSLQAIQKADLFFKEYHALSHVYQDTTRVGYPPYPYEDPFIYKGREISIGSLFRRYGENRKEVRPVLADSPRHLLDKTTGTWYLTKVWYSGMEGDSQKFTCRLSSGFRHQVRAHLAWSGWPIDGDTVYKGAEAEHLALKAVAVEFPHPVTAQPMEIRI